VADFVDSLYASVLLAGTHKASSIKVAEASKVIENTQRDVNIALINELSLIFNLMDIDTQEVLEAAGTKWNFLPFRPGLVGGHCISVDPYYLTHKAQALGYHPEVILAGRRINDGMGAYVADQVVKLMAQKHINTSNARVLIMGFTFKENCPDVRNTGVVDILKKFKEYQLSLDVYDPWVNPEEVKHEYGIEVISTLQKGQYDAIILAVSHQEFMVMGIEKIRSLGNPNCVVYDVKYLFRPDQVDGRL
jgi:UDP-N-acetyl-D-galactosamine dehydrogenase